MTGRSCGATVGAGVVAWLTLTGIALPQVTFRTVLTREDPAPGVEAGATFERFGDPRINDAGQILLYGICDRGHCGLWLLGESGALPVAVDGMPAPGTDEEFELDRFDYSLNRRGDVVVMSGTGDGHPYGIWKGRPGDLSLVALGDTGLPGAGGRYVDLRETRGPAIAEDGTVTFSGHMTGIGSGLWTDRSGQLETVALAGDPAPGLPAPIAYDSRGGGHWGANENGETVFAWDVTLQRPHPQRGLWRSEAPGQAELLAVRYVAGDASAGQFTGIGVPIINRHGHIAVKCTATGNVDGMWVDRGTGLEPVAVTGQHAPGAGDGVTFDRIHSPDIYMNNRADVVFTADLEGPGVDSTNRQSIWLASEGGLELIVRGGQAAPGLADGTGFVPQLLNRGPWPLSLNDRGHMVFHAPVVGEDGDWIDGIWSWLDGDLELVILEGQEIEYAAGVSSKVIDINWANYNQFHHSSSVPSALNNMDQVALVVGFWGTERLIIADLPEPASASLLALGTLFVVCKRRRTRA